MSLVKILSGEPLPLYPEGEAPAMQKYLRDLHNYLRRLGANFTASNIQTTLDEGSGTNPTGNGWKSLRYKFTGAAGTESVITIDSRDMRGFGLVYGITGGPSPADLVNPATSNFAIQIAGTLSCTLSGIAAGGKAVRVVFYADGADGYKLKLMFWNTDSVSLSACCQVSYQLFLVPSTTDSKFVSLTGA